MRCFFGVRAKKDVINEYIRALKDGRLVVDESGNVKDNKKVLFFTSADLKDMEKGNVDCKDLPRMTISK